MPFATKIDIPFGDIDPAGFVYYPNLLHYCHIAMERFFNEVCGVPYHRMLEERRIGFPTVKIETEFFEPLVYGDELLLQIAAVKVGRTSLTLEYRLSRVSDMALCAQAKMVHVAMSLDTRRAIELPNDLLTTLRAQLDHD